MAQKMFVFDFDGTLVDSYACLPDVYASIASHLDLRNRTLREFVNEMQRSEDQQDVLRNDDRYIWWPVVVEQFGIHVSEEKLTQLIHMYWEQRAAKSTIIGKTEETLKWLKACGVLAITCRGDGKHGNKEGRIQKSGLGVLFDEIVIVGEDVENFTQALEFLMRKYDVKRAKVMFFDDKPFAINEISENLPEVITVKVDFKGMLRSAWAQECIPTFKIKTIKETKRIADCQGT